MGESERYIDYRDIRKKITLGGDDNALMGVVTINIIFFVLLMVIQVIYFFFQIDKAVFYRQVVPYFIMPGQAVVFSERPWTLLTFMFTHYSFIRLLSNMLWLWSFGYILQELSGNSRLIPVYLYGGLFGGITFIIGSLLMKHPDAGFLEGSTTGTLALATATTMLSPGYRFFRNLGRGIPLWVFTLVFLLIVFAGTYHSGPSLQLAHLAAALSGVLFILLLRKGHDAGAWMIRLYYWFMHLFNPDPSKQRHQIRQRIFYNHGARDPYSRQHRVTQERVDEILEKIHAKGYHFLTDEEKDLLKRASEDGIL
jgi:membrane associated rhomboid family serine protease